MQGIVFGAVCEVPGVEGGQGQAVDEAAGGDPSVADRAGTAAGLGVGLQLAGPARTDRGMMRQAVSAQVSCFRRPAGRAAGR